MAGSGGASMVESEGNGVGSCDSENGNKRIKFGEEEEEDRLSALPDFLIHRILSFLPTTDLVKTLVLSKWWKYQWTHVPVLTFFPNDGMSHEIFSNFIDKTLILHDCSNMDKFVIELKRFTKEYEYPNLDLWIRFAVRKDVKELILNFNNNFVYYSLPQFLFNNSSLVELKLCTFSLTRIAKVNWECVKTLCLYDCEVEDKEFENVLCGSPLLEHLLLWNCYLFRELVIASKSLKTIILDGVGRECTVIEISCPNVKRLRISGLVWFKSLKLMNLPSSLYATFDFYFDDVELGDEMSHNDCINLLQTLAQIEHVEKLEIGRWLIQKILSTLEHDDCIDDCVDYLPDSDIHRIVSFLPLTKDAFERDLYKMCPFKWTDDPILNFVSNEKFFIDSKNIPLMYLDPRLSLWIRFAAIKTVKELILDCDSTNLQFRREYVLPKFVFNNSSLVKMKLCACYFMPEGKVNWESLKSLQLDHSELGNQALEHVLSGSPLLKCLELRCCSFEGAVVVASEHLKTFILEEFGKDCPALEISCPNLESLKIWGQVGSTCLKLTNLPSSLHATLDLYVLESDDISRDDCMNLVGETTKQILHVKEVEIALTRRGAINSVLVLKDIRVRKDGFT
ncbi:F-box/FBD/LRR-repeat protein At1g16930-like isoform X1 [Euphorbia lathyris]|uniref:F-box/FBD/LRR-repeat protein At1g16930-like isoform X1 n=1 Tax=Euphorbia lathyris TaxID=212925 RepID=UPI003313E734